MAKQTTTVKKSKLKECPQCDEIWTTTEVKYQTCNSCGYPEKDILLNDDIDDDDDFGYDDDSF